MKILNVFDAVLEGKMEDFIKYYDGNIDQVNPYTKLNLLTTAVLNYKNPLDRIYMIEYLISHSIDMNYVDPKYQRNALHTLFFNALSDSADYMNRVVKLLVENGLDVNSLDRFNAIPLNYAIAVTKNSTEDMKDIYLYLLEQGSDYNFKDSFDKSCLDYAKEYSWRHGFIDIVKEYENGKYE